MSYKLDPPQAVAPGPMIHPGPFIRHNLVEPYGLTVPRAAQLLGVDEALLEDALSGRRPVTLDLAFRFEALFGIEPDFLLRWQSKHEQDQGSARRDALKQQISRLPIPITAKG